MGTQITPFAYHSDATQHGSAQYVLLDTIIDEFEADKTDDDHILQNTSRGLILKNVKRAIRKLNKQVFSDVRAIEITVPEGLYIVMPQNYTDYIGLYQSILDPVTGSYRLVDLNVNSNMNIADGILQDSDADILFDNDGNILTADATNVYNKKYKRYTFGSVSSNIATLDTTKLSKHGEFVVDEKNGRIAFNSDLYDKEVVLLYTATGLDAENFPDGKIRVHVDVVEAVIEWAYYFCIKGKKSVGRSTVREVLLRAKTVTHEAKIERSNFDMLQIERELRIFSKNR